MEIVYSNHALERMEERAITGLMVESLLSRPEQVVEGETADGVQRDARRVAGRLSSCLVDTPRDADTHHRAWRSRTVLEERASQVMVESLLSRPEQVVEGETADGVHRGTLEEGRRAIVVLSRGRVPRTVLTVMLARGE